MNLAGEVGLGWVLVGWLGAIAMVMWAMRHAPWYKVVGDGGAQSVFLGMVVVVLLVWSTGAEIDNGLNFHFLLMTLVTLMFGLAFALLLAFLVVVGVTLVGHGDWSILGWNYLLMGGVPVAISWWLAKLAYRFLDRSFFVFVLLNGFFAAAFSTVMALVLIGGVMSLSGLQSWEVVSKQYMSFVPILALPEGFLNGFLLAAMVLFKPNWLACFSDEVYLQGK